MNSLYKSFNYHPTSQLTLPTLTLITHTHIHIFPYTHHNVLKEDKSSWWQPLSHYFELPFPSFWVSWHITLQAAIHSVRLTADTEKGVLPLLKDLAFVLLVILPTKRMRPVSELFLTPLPKHFKRERQERLHDFHANSQPACLPAAANTSYSCW